MVVSTHRIDDSVAFNLPFGIFRNLARSNTEVGGCGSLSQCPRASQLHENVNNGVRHRRYVLCFRFLSLRNLFEETHVSHVVFQHQFSIPSKYSSVLSFPHRPTSASPYLSSPNYIRAFIANRCQRIRGTSSACDRCRWHWHSFSNVFDQAPTSNSCNSNCGESWSWAVIVSRSQLLEFWCDRAIHN